ncbi:uncharacterized protein [Montipora capricornis]|uniref:uncharacterized protein n=1 Tax=Montipora capricornis TaxID=246305 RepID=UPI0035F12D28
MNRYLVGDEINRDDDSDEESDNEDDDDDPDNFEDTGESDQQGSKVDSLKSKLYERARAMKQDGQPINLLPRYVHSRQKPLVGNSNSNSNSNYPTTEKRRFPLPISDTLSQYGIQWFFNPPSAPHFGGVWERLVKLAKKALKIILNGQLVNDETLLTFMAETETETDPQDPEAITRNHFLIGRNSPHVPPNVFDERDLCSRKRWRQAQTLTDHFWRRWLHAYVPALTDRKKWRTGSQTDVQIGDLVLVVEDNVRCGRFHLPHGIPRK